MNRKIQALLWEQGRVAGVLTVWCLGVSMVVLGLLWLGKSHLSSTDFSGIVRTWLYASLAGLGALFLLRQNTEGHLDMHFEARLARLPVSTAALTFIPLGLRLLSFLIYFVIVSGLCYGFTGAPLAMEALPMVAVGYLMVQAIVWTQLDLLYVTVAPILFSPLLYISLRVVGLIPRHNSIADFVSGINAGDVAMACLAIFPFAVGLAWAGVRWERRNEHRRFFSLAGLSEFLQRVQPAINKPFKSSEAARVWFERAGSGISTAGLMLPLMVIAIPVFLLMRAFFDPNSLAYRRVLLGEFLLWVQFAPYLMVIIAMAILGLIRDFSRRAWPLSLTEFTNTKPMSHARLAWLHMAVMSRRAAVCLALAFGLSYLLHATILPEQFLLTVEVLRNSPEPLVAATYFFVPLFWAALLTWLALWCGKSLLIAGTVAMAIGFFGNLLIGASLDFWPVYVYAFWATVLLHTAWLWRWAWKKKLFTPWAWAGFIVLHGMLTVFVWWPGPPENRTAWDAVLLPLTAVALLFSPIIALPRQVERKRTAA